MANKISIVALIRSSRGRGVPGHDVGPGSLRGVRLGARGRLHRLPPCAQVALDPEDNESFVQPTYLCQGLEGEEEGGRPHDHAFRRDWRGI